MESITLPQNRDGVSFISVTYTAPSASKERTADFVSEPYHPRLQLLDRKAGTYAPDVQQPPVVLPLTFGQPHKNDRLFVEVGLHATEERKKALAHRACVASQTLEVSQENLVRITSSPGETAELRFQFDQGVVVLVLQSAAPPASTAVTAAAPLEYLQLTGVRFQLPAASLPLSGVRPYSELQLKLRYPGHASTYPLVPITSDDPPSDAQRLGDLEARRGRRGFVHGPRPDLSALTEDVVLYGVPEDTSPLYIPLTVATAGAGTGATDDAAGGRPNDPVLLQIIARSTVFDGVLDGVQDDWAYPLATIRLAGLRAAFPAVCTGAPAYAQLQFTMPRLPLDFLAAYDAVAKGALAFREITDRLAQTGGADAAAKADARLAADLKAALRDMHSKVLFYSLVVGASADALHDPTGCTMLAADDEFAQCPVAASLDARDGQAFAKAHERLRKLVGYSVSPSSYARPKEARFNALGSLLLRRLPDFYEEARLCRDPLLLHAGSREPADRIGAECVMLSDTGVEASISAPLARTLKGNYLTRMRRLLPYDTPQNRNIFLQCAPLGLSAEQGRSLLVALSIHEDAPASPVFAPAARVQPGATSTVALALTAPRLAVPGVNTADGEAATGGAIVWAVQALPLAKARLNQCTALTLAPSFEASSERLTRLRDAGTRAYTQFQDELRPVSVPFRDSGVWVEAQAAASADERASVLLKAFGGSYLVCDVYSYSRYDCIGSGFLPLRSFLDSFRDAATQRRDVCLRIPVHFCPEAGIPDQHLVCLLACGDFLGTQPGPQGQSPEDDIDRPLNSTPGLPPGAPPVANPDTENVQLLKRIIHDQRLEIAALTARKAPPAPPDPVAAALAEYAGNRGFYKDTQTLIPYPAARIAEAYAADGAYPSGTHGNLHGLAPIDEAVGRQTTVQNACERVLQASGKGLERAPYALVQAAVDLYHTRYALEEASCAPRPQYSDAGGDAEALHALVADQEGIIASLERQLNLLGAKHDALRRKYEEDVARARTTPPGYAVPYPPTQYMPVPYQQSQPAGPLIIHTGAGSPAMAQDNPEYIDANRYLKRQPGHRTSRSSEGRPRNNAALSILDREIERSVQRLTDASKD